MRLQRLVPRLAIATIAGLAIVAAANLMAPEGILAQIPTMTPSPTATRPPGLTTPLVTLTPNATSTPAPAAATPTPAPAGPSPCTLPLATARGGQTVGYESVEVTLPAGDYVYGFVETEPRQLVICNSQTDASVFINARTGQQVSRRSAGAQGDQVINSIMSAVRVTGASGGSGSGILPPNTGDAGLR